MDKNSAKSKLKNTIHLEAKKSVLHLASWLNQINYQVLKPFDLSLPQFHVLRILHVNYPDEMTISGITDKLLDKMPNTSRIVDKLCEKGLVEKKSDEHDKRKANVSLTNFGRVKMKKIIPTIEMTDVNVLQKLSEGEIIQLRDISQKLIDNEK